MILLQAPQPHAFDCTVVEALENSCTARTLLSEIMETVEIRSFASLVDKNDLYKNMLGSLSYKATVFAPKDLAWYSRPSMPAGELSAEEAEKVIQSHVVSSSVVSSLEIGMRLITDLGVKEALLPGSTVAHSLVVGSSSERPLLLLGGSHVRHARCQVFGSALLRECLPSACDECAFAIQSSNVLNYVGAGDGDAVFVDNDGQMDVEDEIISRSPSRSVVLHKIRASNGVIFVLDNTVFPARVVDQKHVEESPNTRIEVATTTPNPPSVPLPSPSPKPKPPPPQLGSPDPLLWRVRPPPPSVAPYASPSHLAGQPKGSCVTASPNICGLCDYSYNELAPCCCDSECASNDPPDCCDDYQTVCLTD